MSWFCYTEESAFLAVVWSFMYSFQQPAQLCLPLMMNPDRDSVMAGGLMCLCSFEAARSVVPLECSWKPGQHGI